MYSKEFNCFFSTISDYIRAQDCISLEFGVAIIKHFLLHKSIMCEDELIDAKQKRPLFCFYFEIRDSFPNKRSVQEVDKEVEKVRNLDFFIDKSRGNYICTMDKLKDYLNPHYDLRRDIAMYFFNSTELVKYCYEHNLFSLDSIPEDLKPHF